MQVQYWLPTIVSEIDIIDSIAKLRGSDVKFFDHPTSSLCTSCATPHAQAAEYLSVHLLGH